MDYRRTIISILMITALFGCAAKEVAPAGATKAPADNATVKTKTVVQTPPPPPPPVLRESFRPFDPLAGRTISFSAENMSVKSALFAVASDAGLNLIIGPDVDQTKLLTAHFVASPVRDALEMIMDLSDLSYEIQGNILRIGKLSTRQFQLPAVPLLGTFDTQIGGDVLGSNSAGGASTALKGKYDLTYKTPGDHKDVYSQIEKNIGDIIGKDAGNVSTLNRQSGVITVTAPHSKLKQIDQFLKQVRAEMGRQVLIEAKLLDVTLSDSFKFGINWTGVFGSTTVRNSLGSTTGNIGVTGTDFTGVINAISTYGNIETLANPRIRVMNGQSALISAGRITPYWEKSTITENNNGATSTNVNYTKSNVLDGVMLGVTPYINEDGTVTLNIIPVSTQTEDTASTADGFAEAPILNVKEAGTVITADSGATVVMGGLISTVKLKKRSKIPLLGDIPGLGVLFQTMEDTTEKRELVIMLRPVIVTSGQSGIQ